VPSDRYTRYPRPVLWLVPGSEAGPTAAASALSTGGDEAVEPFYLSTLPVTNRQLEAALPAWRRSARAPADDDPAVGVPLAVALEYCAWYSQLARKPIRLPTEREWEHACTGGEAAAAGGERNLELAWHAANSPPERVPDLSAKGSNSLGLFAMLGGVWEWVLGDGEGAVLRGGSWLTPPQAIADGARWVVESGVAPVDAGFRIAKPLRS
jgi:formylglycine-generating enzyme required for sulfatase activity